MLSDLAKKKNVISRSISAENKTGEKGKGAMVIEGSCSNCARELGQGWKVSPSVSVGVGETVEIANIAGEGRIRHMWLVDDTSHAIPRVMILRIYWDDSDTPSVEVPMGDFFACADARGYAPMSSLAVCVNPKSGYNCYWDMPFYKRCRITVENIFHKPVQIYYQIDYSLEELEKGLCYFHAQFRRVNPLPYKQPYTLLDNVQGKGQYVGTYMFWGVHNNGWWGEGEIKFYLDGDKEFPTICGTGTEDYFGGSYNFDVGGKYLEFCTPYCGMNKVIRGDGLYNVCQRFSLYRWHITDPIYFNEDIRVTIQALGWRSNGRFMPLQDDIASVSFWYQDSICKTFPPLPSIDELEII